MKRKPQKCAFWVGLFFVASYCILATLCPEYSSFPAAFHLSVMNDNAKRLQTKILSTEASALDSAFLQSCVLPREGCRAAAQQQAPILG